MGYNGPAPGDHWRGSKLHRTFYILVAIAFLIGIEWCANAQPAPMPASPAFIVGVWAQPVVFMDRWADRGVNTLFGAANDTTKAQWEAAAAQRGLYFIDYAGADPTTEAHQPFRIGFLQPDEPDMPSHVNTPGSTIGDLRTNYARLKPLGQPVFINQLGSAFDNPAYDGTPHPGKTDASLWGHRAATNGYMGQADVVGFDYHLWTSGRPGAFDITRRLMDRCNDWSGGKPILLYVESCTQGTGKPFTADDYETQVWQAVVYASQRGYKLRGIVYFATGVYGGGAWPDRFDVTPPDVAERMKIVHAKLAAFAAGKVYASATAPSPATLPTTTPVTPPALGDIQKQLDFISTKLIDLNQKLDRGFVPTPAATQPNR